MKYLLLLLLTGCAINSGVQPMGGDQYIVSRQAASALTGMGKLRADAMVEAYAQCQLDSKVVEVIEVNNAEPPFVMGNYPRTEIIFRCV